MTLCRSAAMLAMACMLQRCTTEFSGSEGGLADGPSGGAGVAFLSSQADKQTEQACLCAFDIDRTLTGRQADVVKCPRNKLMQGVHDSAYGGGGLTLSALATVGINTTFCGNCYLGVVSAGDADGDNSAERAVLLEQVLQTSPYADLRQSVPSASSWSFSTDIKSPLVLGAKNKEKQHSLEAIRQWYSQQGVCIARSSVHFFGDRSENIPPFKKMGFNAREISCGSRDPTLYHGSGMVGYCGAIPEEIVNDTGVASCLPQLPEEQPSAQACLCVFDIDRTLTGRQADVVKCPRNKLMQGVHDSAYGGGELTLSALATVGINTTFCGNCYLGVVSAGDADGDNSAERAVLLEQVLQTSPYADLRQSVPSASSWSFSTDIKSPLVLGAKNKEKQHSLEAIRQWYSQQGINISTTSVHFFGDRSENIPPFKEMGFNAREISCGSRDPTLYHGSGMVGYCGAIPEEIVNDTGVASCLPQLLEEQPSAQACLCAFDIDRTLTGRQADVVKCPRNKLMQGVHDSAYGGGELTLSALATVGINTTFCGNCYLGVVSAGDADGDNSAERAVLLEQVLQTSPYADLRQSVPSASSWSFSTDIKSPLVLGAKNREKQHSLEAIRQWYSQQGVCIARSSVHFFGDRSENIPPFKKMGFNAREISCGSRDPTLYHGSGMVGYCGAMPEEIVNDTGVASCYK
ncbi:unnamed protein product [Polarella glacialis]|uniref:Uncharacterized protein n=1 Tax=Polarella glacialis TaxID=89957 RepID=A0A813HS27_POLGL|nr:unnamed protein product [Polarella glacialis]